MNAENFIARQSVIKQTHRNLLKRRTRRLGSVTFQIPERRGAWNKWCQLFYTFAQQLLSCSSSTSSFSLLVPFLLTFLLHISRHFPHFLERLAAQISHVFDGVRKHTHTTTRRNWAIQSILPWRAPENRGEEESSYLRPARRRLHWFASPISSRQALCCQTNVAL